MLYDLSKEIDLQRADKRFKQLSEQRTVIELKKKVKRSTSQNSYLHLILGWFAIETGYTLSEAKLLYKNLSNEIYWYRKRNESFYRSSADLTTKEMTESIEKFRNWSSATAKVYLPEPSDLNFLQEIEIEMSKHKYL